MANTLHTFQIVRLGVSIEVSTDDAAVCRYLSTVYTSCTPPAEAPKLNTVFKIVLLSLQEHWECTIDGRVGCLQKEWGLHRIADLIKIISVHARQDLRFVHASSVQFHDAVALFVGASTSGKTTLALGLSNCGAVHFSDDISPISTVERLAYPFRTAPQLRPGPAISPPPRQPTGQPAPLRWIFFLALDDSGEKISTREHTTKIRDHLQWLATGREAATPERIVQMTVRDPACFDRPPSLRIASEVETARGLLNHILQPCPDLPTMFREMERLTPHIRAYHLTSGHLPATCEMIQDICSQN